MNFSTYMYTHMQIHSKMDSVELLRADSSDHQCMPLHTYIYTIYLYVRMFMLKEYEYKQPVGGSQGG